VVAILSAACRGGCERQMHSLTLTIRYNGKQKLPLSKQSFSASFGGGSAEQARDKLELNRFEKRFRIYNATPDFISAVAGNVSGNIGQEQVVKFDMARSEAFLFIPVMSGINPKSNSSTIPKTKPANSSGVIKSQPGEAGAKRQMK